MNSRSYERQPDSAAANVRSRQFVWRFAVAVQGRRDRCGLNDSCLLEVFDAQNALPTEFRPKIDQPVVKSIRIQFSNGLAITHVQLATGGQVS
jgi:hypothetical protein